MDYCDIGCSLECWYRGSPPLSECLVRRMATDHTGARSVLLGEQGNLISECGELGRGTKRLSPPNISVQLVKVATSVWGLRQLISTRI